MLEFFFLQTMFASQKNDETFFYHIFFSFIFFSFHFIQGDYLLILIFTVEKMRKERVCSIFVQLIKCIYLKVVIGRDAKPFR